MSLSSVAHTILTRLLDWWRDREDERLDELVAIYARNSDGPAGLARTNEAHPDGNAWDGHHLS